GRGGGPSGAGRDRRADGPGRRQRAGGGGVVAGGGVVGGVAAGVDQPRGLLGVVVPAQAVEVPQAGPAASAGVIVVVLDDVVVLGGEHGGAGAAGHGADGVAQPQLESHLRGGVVGLGAHGQVRPGDRV